MRFNRQTFSRHRPRILTLLVLVVTAAILVMSNLSFDESDDGGSEVFHRSYGWPVIWHRIVFSSWDCLGFRIVGWYCNVPRLAGNLLCWLAILAGSAGACEWWLRRYPPRLRFSLRSMLVVVAFAAVGCSWFVGARNQANLQDRFFDFEASGRHASFDGASWPEGGHVITARF
jgi:hypothetical protein